jgi:hypothetical protein
MFPSVVTNIRAAKAKRPERRAGWYPDPADHLRLRYWDGARWTRHVGELTRAG